MSRVSEFAEKFLGMLSRWGRWKSAIALALAFLFSLAAMPLSALAELGETAAPPDTATTAANVSSPEPAADTKPQQTSEPPASTDLSQDSSPSPETSQSAEPGPTPPEPTLSLTPIPSQDSEAQPSPEPSAEPSPPPSLSPSPSPTPSPSPAPAVASPTDAVIIIEFDPNPYTDPDDPDTHDIYADMGTAKDDLPLPDTLKATVEGGEEFAYTVSVDRWKCIGVVNWDTEDVNGELAEGEYNPDVPGTYRFEPVLALNEDEALAEGVELPAVSVTVSGGVMFAVMSTLTTEISYTLMYNSAEGKWVFQDVVVAEPPSGFLGYKSINLAFPSEMTFNFAARSGWSVVISPTTAEFTSMNITIADPDTQGTAAQLTEFFSAPTTYLSLKTAGTYPAAGAMVDVMIDKGTILRYFESTTSVHFFEWVGTVRSWMAAYNDCKTRE